MKRTWILLVVLLGLIGLWWFTTTQEKEQMEVLSFERDFRIEKPKDIGSVKLSYRDREPILLERKGKDWFVNDSIKAWLPVVQGFLGTLRDMRVSYTPTSKTNAKVKKDIEEFGIDVEIRDRNGSVIQSYSIGGVTPDERGTFALKPGTEQSFVIYIPYQEGGLRRRFTRDVEEWRNRFLFEEKWEEISKVTVSYSHMNDKSFVLQKDDVSAYSIYRPGENSEDSRKPVSKGVAEAYLRNFEQIGIEAFENNYKKRDSVLTLQPYASVTLEKDNGESKWIKLFPIHPQTGEVDVSPEHARTTQLFRFFGHYSTDDFVLIQHFTIGGTLKSYSDFMQ